VSPSDPFVPFAVLTNYQERRFERMFMVDENGSQLTYTRTDGDFYYTHGGPHHRNARQPRQDDHPLRHARVQDFSWPRVCHRRDCPEPCPYTNAIAWTGQRPSYNNHVRHLESVYNVLNGATFNLALAFCFANKPGRSISISDL